MEQISISGLGDGADGNVEFAAPGHTLVQVTEGFFSEARGSEASLVKAEIRDSIRPDCDLRLEQRAAQIIIIVT